MTNELTPNETSRLHELESVIERGLRTFVDVGNALKEIKDKRLYEKEHATFEEYCLKRWEFKRTYAHYVIESAEVVNSLNVHNCEQIPATESQARELAKLKEPEMIRETWQEITETVPQKEITAKIIREHVEVKLQDPSTPTRDVDFITLDDWKTGKRPPEVRKLDAKFNRPNDNIEWARWSWNPVTGCLNGCEYCYARDIAHRFYEYLPGDRFAPALYPSRLLAPENMKLPKAAERDVGEKNVFTCSMADLFGKWVPVEWINRVLDAAAESPEWNFLFLTKFPQRLLEFELPANAWVGCTVDTQARVKTAEDIFSEIKAKVKFVSCEPLLEAVRFNDLNVFDWLIIGGRSASSGAGEFKPPRAWVNSLEGQAQESGCPVYEKTNLWARIREYPNGQVSMREEDELGVEQQVEVPF